MLELLERVRACDPDRSEVRHVERHCIGPAGSVFGHRSGRIGDGHLPPSERNHLRPESDMCGVQR
jgi:hypothetical protein